MKNVIGFIVIVILAAGLLWLLSPEEIPVDNVQVTDIYTKTTTEKGDVYVFTPGISQEEIDKIIKSKQGEFVEDGELKIFYENSKQ